MEGDIEVWSKKKNKKKTTGFLKFAHDGYKKMSQNQKKSANTAKIYFISSP